MTDAEPGREALRLMARVLEQQPTKDDHALSALTQSLARFREAMIRRNAGEASTPETREALMHVNAIVSVTMGMHFPLGPPPWAEFGKARNWLADLVGRA